jgi:chemotaxis protein CheC
VQDYNNLNDFQMDILREIGNIGAGNAATALSEFLCDKVILTAPELHVIDVDKMADLLGGPENEAVGILIEMKLDIKGMLMFILDKKFTHLLINVLLNENSEGFENITDMGMSALMEIGNILSGSYVNAISAMTGLNIGLSTPQISIDMVGSILSYPAAVFGEMGDKLLLIEENFISKMNTVKSYLLIIPDLKSLEIILKILGEI